ncbi:MAG: biotin--[Lachnospiraceae bacterium]|nr:biotin--[acetyl-CoA-carboxylase] ligase [Lachnospiraceae bacterium]
MKTSDEVLALLKENMGGFISGQQIADRLYMTRAAVWKAIKSLKKSGYEIEAVTNKGYRLRRTADVINAVYIEEGLRTAGLPVCVTYKEETGSTNEDAGYLIKASKDPVLVIANMQNQGRGRRGRDFYSPKGTGLYMSLALNRAAELLKTVKVTAIAAVAVSQAIDNIVYNGRNASFIKWVNDIYIDEKKVCGILSEAFLSMEDEEQGYVVVGMGINVYEPGEGFPADIKKKAGYLIGAGQQVKTGLRNDLAVEVIRLFFHYMNAADESLAIYRRKSNLIGNYVKVNSFVPDDKASGYARVLGIDDECRLLIEYENGQKETLTSGEVSVVKY